MAVRATAAPATTVRATAAVAGSSACARVGSSVSIPATAAVAVAADTPARGTPASVRATAGAMDMESVTRAPAATAAAVGVMVRAMARATE